MSMNMNLIKHGTEGILQLQGYIDASNAAEVEKIFVDDYDDFRLFLGFLDMEKLEYVSSAGLRAFKRLYMEMRQKHGTLMAKNVGKMVMEVLEVTGFTRLFKFI